MKLVKEIAKTENVIAISPKVTLDKCLSLMLYTGVKHLPVVDVDGLNEKFDEEEGAPNEPTYVKKNEAKLIGIVSDRDIRLAAESPVSLSSSYPEDLINRLKKNVAKDIMTEDVVTCTPEDTIYDSLANIIASDVGCLCVAAKDDENNLFLNGILSRTDFLKLFKEMLKKDL